MRSVCIRVAGLALGAWLWAGVAEAQTDIRGLPAVSEPSAWTATESSVAVSRLQLQGAPCLQWSVPIDHQAGEPKYPIGWPRMMFRPAASEAAWHLYDRMELQVQVESSRPEAGPVPVSLTFYVKDDKQGHSLQLKLPPGAWQTVDLPIADLPEPAILTGLRAAISESNFQHGDRLEFHFGGARLLRSAECVLEKLAVAGTVWQDGRRQLPVVTVMRGPASDVARGIPFQVSRRGEVLRREVLPVIRGEQSWLMDLGELGLPPGEYELTAFPGHPVQERQALFTVEP